MASKGNEGKGTDGSSIVRLSGMKLSRNTYTDNVCHCRDLSPPSCHTSRL
jgi:hypothetical protein